MPNGWDGVEVPALKELHEALAKRYQVVEEAGPGVMKVEVALLDAEAATPGVRSVTMVVPQLRLLSAGYAVVAGRAELEEGRSRRLPGGSGETSRTRSSSWSTLLADAMYAYSSGEKKP